MAPLAAFSRVATRLTDWTQRYVPGTFTIAWLLTLIVLILGVTVGRASLLTCVAAWGDGAAKLDFRDILGFCLILFCIYAPLVSLWFLLFPR